jgi:phenylacetic acid degradation protein PaaN
MEEVWKALKTELEKTLIGNPLNEKVRMGSLAGNDQRNEVKAQVQKLLASSEILYGSMDSVTVIDADEHIGAFMSPMLLLNKTPFTSDEPHNIEAFGPVSTIMPYNTMDEAIELSKKGKGSLCSSIVTNSSANAKAYVLGAASYHGRILVLNNECAKESTGHGSPLPLLVHGGPGRAGGGEEMGGLRGIRHYLQRTAIQGSPSMITVVELDALACLGSLRRLALVGNPGQIERVFDARRTPYNSFLLDEHMTGQFEHVARVGEQQAQYRARAKAQGQDAELNAAVQEAVEAAEAGRVLLLAP